MELNVPGTIIIKNQSNVTVYVRINDKSGVPINFNEIPNGCEGKWNRRPNMCFMMQFTLSPNNSNGPTYMVYAGEVYTIGKGFAVRELSGELATPSYENFDEEEDEDFDYNEEGEDVIEQDEEEIEEEDQDPKVKKNIIIINKNGNEVRVRVMPDPSGGSYNLWPITDGQWESWSRPGGEFLCEILTYDDVSYRYYLKKNRTYTFNENCQLLNKKGEEIEETDDPFNIIIEKPKEIISYDSIKVTNGSNVPIYGRVQSKEGFGSEDLFTIEAGKAYAWKRAPGKYLMELSNDDETGNYLIESGHSYTCTDILVDDNTGNEVELTDDEFQMSSLKPSKKQESVVEEKLVVYEIDDKVPYHKNVKPKAVKGAKFVDDMFPTNKNTLLGVDHQGKDIATNFEHGEKEVMSIDGMEFKRITDLYGNNFHLFLDEIEARDISQGDLGDCWLMSSIAALAGRPELIRKVFKTRSANPEGFYELYFFENGERKVMFMDDHVVCRDGKPCFANPNGNEIWVLLLEKLMAKYEGGYNNIDGGFCGDALTFLTGGVSQHYDQNLKDKWQEICSAIQRGNIITCGTFCAEGKTDKDKNDGICYGHAYSIIDAREYRSKDKNFKLVKLRNPWGCGEWEGKWSDNDKSWTPEYREFFNFKEGANDDGLFYMEYSDFCKYFEEIYICNI